MVHLEDAAVTDAAVLGSERLHSAACVTQERQVRRPLIAANSLHLEVIFGLMLRDEAGIQEGAFGEGEDAEHVEEEEADNEAPTVGPSRGEDFEEEGGIQEEQASEDKEDLRLPLPTRRSEHDRPGIEGGKILGDTDRL